MEQSILQQITETNEGYTVKELRYNQRDNLIVGRVKCPILGRPTLHDGFVTCCWSINGKVHHRYGGGLRPDLEIKVR